MSRPAQCDLYDADGHPRPARETLPTMYDLPSEDPQEPGLPDDFHFHQPQLLRETFVVPGRDPEALFIAYDDRMRAFVLSGLHYRDCTPEDGRLWLPEVNLGLGIWHGRYAHNERDWLRFFTADGRWVPRPVELEGQRAALAMKQADEERRRDDQAIQLATEAQARAKQQEAEARAARTEVKRMQAKLRALGIDPDAE
jgi:hypothetical protein